VVLTPNWNITKVHYLQKVGMPEVVQEPLVQYPQ